MVLSVPLMAYCVALHPLILGDKYEFLPLMLISSYCSLGVIASWIGFYSVYITF